MPSLRGIECHLTTNHGRDLIPEFPHPDGASVKLGDGQAFRGLALSPTQAPGGVSSSPSPSRATKTNPTVSAYVPSIPGKLTPDITNLAVLLTDHRVTLFDSLQGQPSAASAVQISLLQTPHQWPADHLLGSGRGCRCRRQSFQLAVGTWVAVRRTSWR